MRSLPGWRLLRDSDLEPEAVAGVVVYPAGRDYGMGAIDSHLVGYERVSVSLREDGGGPIFTVPRTDLEELP